MLDVLSCALLIGCSQSDTAVLLTLRFTMSHTCTERCCSLLTLLWIVPLLLTLSTYSCKGAGCYEDPLHAI
jgi:hypothetical protein